MDIGYIVRLQEAHLSPDLLFLHLQAVKEVLQRMMKAGISLREDTFNTLMTAALENNDTQVVPNLFSQLLSLNLRPDSLSYTSLITALSRLSRPEAAVRTFTECLALNFERNATAVCASGVF